MQCEAGHRSAVYSLVVLRRYSSAPSFHRTWIMKRILSKVFSAEMIMWPRNESSLITVYPLHVSVNSIWNCFIEDLKHDCLLVPLTCATGLRCLHPRPPVSPHTLPLEPSFWTSLPLLSRLFVRGSLILSGVSCLSVSVQDKAQCVSGSPQKWTP